MCRILKDLRKCGTIFLQLGESAIYDKIGEKQLPQELCMNGCINYCFNIKSFKMKKLFLKL